MISLRTLIAASLCAAIVTTSPVAAADNELTSQEKSEGYLLLFNGKDLTGWQVLPEYWSVRDRVLTGVTTSKSPMKQTTFAICTAGDFDDFELHADFKVAAGEPNAFANSGIQYRSTVTNSAKCSVRGYQADMNFPGTLDGFLYEEGTGRGVLAKGGEKVILRKGDTPKKPKIAVVGSVGELKDIRAAVKPDGWNQYVIIAKGNHLQQFVNGKQTVDVTDETPEAAKTGVIALQLHGHSVMIVSFKNIKIRKID